MKRAGTIVVGGVVLAGLCALAAGAFYATKSSEANTTDSASESRENRIPVVVTPAKKMEFESGAVVSGNVQAKNCALLSARLPAAACVLGRVQ